MRLVFAVLLAAACDREPALAAAPVSTPAGAPLTADTVFSSVCARCHGADGQGGPPTDAGPAPKNFRDRAFQAARTDAQLKAVIVAGKNNAMPAFGATFDEAVLDGLVARIRSFNPKEENP